MNEILNKLENLVRYSWEGNYCDDAPLFRLFREAKPYDLTGSMLATQLGEMLYSIEDGRSEDSKDYFVERITLRWDAWRYASKHYPRTESRESLGKGQA